MALAGVRPEETSHVTISSRADGALIFHVRGVKVSDVKGQPERTITVRSDQPEFAFLSQQLATAGRELILKAPDGLKNPTEALVAAVRRAGAAALGADWGFSAYVYRHSLAADCKKDGMARVDLAFLLGHSVTETGGLYGFWQGGRKGVRNISAVGTRVVKENHHHGKVLPPSPRLPEFDI
jgi:integrase